MNKYLPYILAKYYSITEDVDRRSLTLDYTVPELRIEDFSNYNPEVLWRAELRYLPPTIEELENVAADLGISTLRRGDSSRVLLMGQELFFYLQILALVDKDAEKSIRNSVKNILETMIPYGNSGFINISQDPDA